MADAPGEAPRQPLGGAFHTYLGFDAVRFGTAMPSDAGGAARGAFEHMLATGETVFHQIILPREEEKREEEKRGQSQRA